YQTDDTALVANQATSQVIDVVSERFRGIDDLAPRFRRHARTARKRPGNGRAGNASMPCHFLRADEFFLGHPSSSDRANVACVANVCKPSIAWKDNCFDT